jgi:hypothetical protein
MHTKLRLKTEGKGSIGDPGIIGIIILKWI